MDIKTEGGLLTRSPGTPFCPAGPESPCKENIKRNEINSEARYPCFYFLPFLRSAFYRGGGGGGRSDVEGLSNERGKIADTKSAGKKAWLVLIILLIG